MLSNSASTSTNYSHGTGTPDLQVKKLTYAADTAQTIRQKIETTDNKQTADLQLTSEAHLGIWNRTGSAGKRIQSH